MEIQKEKPIYKQPLFLASIAILILLGIGVSYAYFATDIFKDKTPDTPISQQPDDTNDTNNPPADPQDEDKDTPPDTSTPNQPEETNPPETPPNETSARIHIPNHQALDGVITVNVAISEPWSGQARCVTEIRGPVSRTIRSDVFPQAQIAGCQVRATGLTPGEYKLSIHAENGSLRTNTETITVNL